MRDPQERVNEIFRRADNRLAAIKRTKRTVAGICATTAMCLVIGLGIIKQQSLPSFPPLEPSVATTTSATAVITTTTHTTTAVPSRITTSATEEGVYTTVTTTPPVTTSVTSHITTTHRRTTTTHRRTTTTASHIATTTSRSTATTATIEDEPRTTTSPFTTTTTVTPTATTTTCSSDQSINGTDNPGNPPQFPPDTATTTRTAVCSVVTYSISSAHNVSVGDLITVDVIVSDDHYMVYGAFQIDYDPNALELVPVCDNPDNPYLDHVNTNVLTNQSNWQLELEAPGSALFFFGTYAATGSQQGGTMFTLTFRVLDGLTDSTALHGSIRYMFSADHTNQGVPNDYETPYTIEDGVITRK